MREIDHLLGASDTLVLMVSRDCNIACNYCAVPPDGHRLDAELCLRLVREARAIEGLEVIAFTGGEPFLYLEELAPVTAECRRLGLPIKAISNAYWATDAVAARATLAPLIADGLALLALSADPSHQAFVPKANIEIAARAALELGVRVHVVGSFPRAGMRVEEFLDLPAHPELRTASYVVQPFGRAREWPLTQERMGFSEGAEAWTCYATTRYDVLVTPSGAVLPCCSTATDHNRLVFGNVRTEPLAGIVARVRDDFAVQILKRRSFAYLYEAVQSVDPDLHALLPPPEAQVSACALCVAVLSDPVLGPRVRRALELHRLDLVSATL